MRIYFFECNKTNPMHVHHWKGWNKRKPIPATYTIHGQVLEVVDSAKYLGVHLDTHLNFNTHVDAITKRANGTRAFLSRNLSHCSQKVKEAAYTMFVRPSVEFASSAWDPPHPKKHSEIGAGAEKLSPFCCGRLPTYQQRLWYDQLS